MITLSCPQCTKSFSIKPSRLKDGYVKYCSRTCAHKANRKGKLMECGICGKKSYKQLRALKASKSGKFFCGKSCQTIWRNKEFIEEKHANWKGGKHAYRRVMIQSDKQQVCGLCKTRDLRILAVHHLDEDRKNNAIENLFWLCHNCHHLVHYYPDEQEKFMATIV